MDIIIQSLGFKASEDLENFIREKLTALKSDHIVRANVAMYKGPDSNPENSYSEIRLEVPGNDLFVKKNSQHFESSISECVDVLTQKINKAKHKTEDRRKGDAAEIQDVLLTDDSNDEVELEDVVK